MEPENPRLLIEGGPVHRRVNHLLALTIGILVGSVAALSWLTVRTGDQQHRNCTNIGRLARIEHGLIGRQEAQTHALLAQGVTFGLSKTQIPGLLAASDRSDALFLGELDDLARSNC